MTSVVSGARYMRLSWGPKVHDHINDRRTLTRMNRHQLPSPEDANFLDLNADTIH